MVFESNGYGVGKERLWCWRVTVMVFGEEILQQLLGDHLRVTVMVLQSNGDRVRGVLQWCYSGDGVKE
jgi:hypothetical protein